LSKDDKKKVEGHCLESADQIKEALDEQRENIKKVEELELYVKASKLLGHGVDKLD